MSLNNLPETAHQFDSGFISTEHDSYVYIGSSSTETVGGIGPSVSNGEIYEFSLTISSYERTVGPLEIRLSDPDGSQFHEEHLMSYTEKTAEINRYLTHGMLANDASTPQMQLEIRNRDGSNADRLSWSLEYVKLSQNAAAYGLTHDQAVNVESFDS